MKKNALRIIKTSFRILVLTVFVGVLFSCSNYMGEDDLVKTLENNTGSNTSVSPVASIQAPAFFEGGVPKNRKLIISFSKSMDTKSVWDNIIITDSLGKNLKEYFSAPVWSNEDTVLEITPLSDNLIDLKKKSFFDIYVTIPNTVVDKDSHALFNPIDYRYRINDTIDEAAPELITVRAEADTTLVLGEFNSASEEKICQTNHINSKFDFYLEGSDYASGEVWASFKFKRIYDVQGNAVAEKEYSKLIKLTHLTVSENYYDTVCFDLSDSRYLDGMYRIQAAISDASGQISSNQCVVNVIRDTSFELSSNAAIDFCSQSDETLYTKDQLESFANVIQFKNIKNDVYFTSKLSESSKTYTSSTKDFTCMLSWGVSLSELCEPVKISGAEDYIVLPEAYRRFRAANNKKDVYLSATVYDCVGNSQVINAVVPGLIDFFNYEVSDGTSEDYKKIKLNFSDLANSSSDLSDVPDKNNTVSYRIYYGKKDTARNSQILFKRNVSESESASGSDSTEFQIEVNSVYVVYIQPVYSSNSKTNGQRSGQTFGPLYEVEVDAIATGEDPEKYTFTVSKTSDGPNTGTYTIDVNISKTEDGVSYYPCFSADGMNWSTYKELTFKVQNPLKAPVKKGQSWSKESLWKDKSFFEVRDSLADFYKDYKEIFAKVRILAIKGNKAVYSDYKNIVFTRDDDNIPPQASTLVSSHDSMLSYDGRSYKFEGLIREDDFNTNERFKYYYTEYNQSWGSSLSCLTDEQILNLPGSTSKLSAKIWNDGNGNLEYSLTPVIPVNGLKDGSYMFFAKVSDLYGNEKLITLGKTDINTFKNKLNVSYDAKYNQFNSTLVLAENELNFDRNMINIQQLALEQKDALTVAQWKDFYEAQNELQDCIVDVQNRMLKSTTKNTIEVIDKDYGFKTTKTKNLTKGAFYRISVQSFNENPYNEQTNHGVNKKNGRPYGDELEASAIVDFVENETEYDLYTQETVSNPVYYYVPGADEDMSRFKGSFFKNTVAISSNKPVIVNLISSMNNLGSDIDEWERRGKLVKTYYFKGDSSGIPFKDNDVRDDILNLDDEGLIYYVMVVHFANNTSEISNVYKLLK